MDRRNVLDLIRAVNAFWEVLIYFWARLAVFTVCQHGFMGEHSQGSPVRWLPGSACTVGVLIMWSANPGARPRPPRAERLQQKGPGEHRSRFKSC